MAKKQRTQQDITSDRSDLSKKLDRGEITEADYQREMSSLDEEILQLGAEKSESERVAKARANAEAATENFLTMSVVRALKKDGLLQSENPSSQDLKRAVATAQKNHEENPNYVRVVNKAQSVVNDFWDGNGTLPQGGGFEKWYEEAAAMPEKKEEKKEEEKEEKPKKKDLQKFKDSDSPGDGGDVENPSAEQDEGFTKEELARIDKFVKGEVLSKEEIEWVARHSDLKPE